MGQKMLDIQRMRRAWSRITSRTQDYSGLRKAGTIAEATEWFRSNNPRMLNGNVLRAKVVQLSAEIAKCTVFVETGTSHAATTIGANRFLQIPVWSCENAPWEYRISKAITLGLRNITLYKLDSRAFLRLVTSRLQHEKQTPMLYLDAHEGTLDASSLPLAEELEFVFSLDSFVVIVDDFRVPHDDSFVFGTYGETSIELPLIRNLLLRAGILDCYFPSYRSSEETGFVTGFCLFWRSRELDEEMPRRAFPSNLIRRFNLERNEYV
jgi:hypothetical protein